MRRAGGVEAGEGRIDGRGVVDVLVDDYERQCAIRCPYSAEGRKIVRVRHGGLNAGVAEHGFVAVIIAVHLDRIIGGRVGGRRRPARGQIQIFASENAKNVCLCGCAVDRRFSAPIVFRDAGFSAGIIGRYPASHAWDEHDDVVDPAGIHIVRVPEHAGGLVPQQLRRGINGIAR